MFDEILKQIERVKNEEVRSNPSRIADALVWFSSMYASMTEQLVDLELGYNRELVAQLQADISVAKAEAIAKTSTAYRDYLKGKQLEKALIEVIRSLKYWIRVKEDEYSETN